MSYICDIDRYLYLYICICIYINSLGVQKDMPSEFVHGIVYDACRDDKITI